jgi:PAS domain S-box-containing protein
MARESRKSEGVRATPAVRASASPGPRHVPLSTEELQTLRRAIAEVAGSEAADEVLFQVGRRWGEREAARLRSLEDDQRSLLVKGFHSLDELGLGQLSLEQLTLDIAQGECRVVGTVLDSAELRALSESGRSEGTVCGLTVGFLTGLTAGVTGLDVVCSPFHCSRECDHCGCRFEIAPAHLRDAVAPGRRAPSGSARFFLGAMGKSLADADISLDDLVENTADAVILIDGSDRIRFWNRGAEQMFGWSREEVVGRKVGFVVPDDLLESDELGTLRARLERTGTIHNYVTRRVRKDGRELWVSLTRTVLHDSQGRVVGSTATLRDVTEQRRTEEELYRSRGLAMIGELSAKIAHEIKNPLAGIYAAVQLLSRDFPPGDPRRVIFDDVGGEIRRLDDTVQDLLRFARPLPPHPRPTGLRNFVLDLLEPLRHQPEVQRHTLKVEVPEDMLVDIDPRLMGQVLTNLVLNAAQAQEEPGTIGVRATCLGDRVAIDVIDSGPGIPAAQRREVFEPFYTTKTRGTGLGLPIAAKNVQAHRGTLELVAGEGPGAHFRITLPQLCDLPPAQPGRA